VAAECYEANLPLPANLAPRVRRLAEEMHRFLTLSEPERWWSDLPLPLPPVSR
jgi:hypothetical protein